MQALLEDRLGDIIEVHEEDDGIGEYEYMGAPGIHTEWNPYCNAEVGFFELKWGQSHKKIDVSDKVIKITKYIERNVNYYPEVDEYLGEEVPVSVQVRCTVKGYSCELNPAMAKWPEQKYLCTSLVWWEVEEVEYGRAK